MTDTVSGAIDKRDNGPGAMIKQYSGDFGMVLPEHIKPATFVRLAQGILRRDQKLAKTAQQNPGSLMAALLECARLGHDPGTDAFYFVPFGNEIQGIEGYRGVVERIFRAGAVANVKAEIVHAGDHYRFSPTAMQVPEFETDDFADDRGPIIGAFAYAEMKDGTVSRVVRINRSYIDKVKAESKGSSSSSHPWTKWEPQMILKTVLKRLEPFVPTSTEYRREQLRTAREVDTEQQHPELRATAPVDVSALPEAPAEAEIVEPDPRDEQ